MSQKKPNTLLQVILGQTENEPSISYSDLEMSIFLSYALPVGTIIYGKSSRWHDLDLEVVGYTHDLSSGTTTLKAVVVSSCFFHGEPHTPARRKATPEEIEQTLRNDGWELLK